MFASFALEALLLFKVEETPVFQLQSKATEDSSKRIIVFRSLGSVRIRIRKVRRILASSSVIVLILSLY